MFKKSATLAPSKAQLQREEAAKIEAAKALSFKETPVPTHIPEREKTLKQRLEDVDRRAKEAAERALANAEDEKKKLAGHYLAEAVAKFKRLIALADDELRSAYEEMIELQRMAGDGVTESTRSTNRTTEELTAIAEDIVAFIKSSPTPLRGGVIKSYVQEKHDYKLLQILPWIEKYIPDVDKLIKTDGEKAGMVYYHV